MRKSIVIIAFGLFFSCADNYKNLDSKGMEAETFNPYNELLSKELSLEELTSQKLLDYYDLLRLLEGSSTAFKEDITKQLSALTKEPFSEMDSLDGISIRNIHQIGSVEKISDSVQKIKLNYDIFFNDTVKTDSIIALITTKALLVDGAETKSTNVTFTRANR